MLKYLFSTIIFAIILSVSSAFAQEEEVAEKTKRKPQDRLVAELFFDQLINKPEGLGIKGFSRGFNMYFTYDVPLGKSNFSVAPGVGIGTSNYFMNKSLDYTSFGDTIKFVDFGDSTRFKKNKIGLTYLDIPVEIRFRSKPNKNNKSWKIAAGFKFGVLLANKWKYRGQEFRDGNVNIREGQQVKFKEFNIPNLERLRYGVTLRGGYGPLNLFVYYGLSNLFDKNLGPGMNTIQAGISITGL